MSAGPGSQGFAARSRHDLLTYVNHICGFTELILDLSQEQLQAGDAARLHAILADGRKLAALIDALFDPLVSAEKRRLMGAEGVRQQLRAPLLRILDTGELLLQAWQGRGDGAAEDLGNVVLAAQELTALLDTGLDLTTSTSALQSRASEPAAPEPEPLRGGRVLVVDDNEANREVLSRHLQRMGCAVSTAAHGRAAMQMLRAEPVDLVLLDVMMPEMDGYEVLAQIKASDSLRHLPVIMISALDQMDAVVRCIQAGAADFLSKPFEPVLLRARVAACIEVKRLHDQERGYRHQMEDYNLHLETRVREQVRALTKAQLGTIFALSKLAESRDTDTGDHLDRMREYSRLLAIELARHPAYAGVIDDGFVDCLYAASPLHDIGKVAIPDAVLRKPGKLEPEEFELMKTHSRLGADCLRAVHGQHPGNDFIGMGIQIAESHHEKWDGSGYPNGLRGEEIPLAARLCALADVYDALTSKRCYKPAFPHEKAVEIIRAESGRAFAPDVVEAFLVIAHTFPAVALRYSDGAGQL